MKNKINLNDIAAEICKREKSKGREVNITDVKRVLRHLGDLMAEEWQKDFDLSIAKALRCSGLRRLRKKQ